MKTGEGDCGAGSESGVGEGSGLCDSAAGSWGKIGCAAASSPCADPATARAKVPINADRFQTQRLSFMPQA